MRIQLTAAATRRGRTIRALIAPYGVAGYTSAGPLVIRAGSLRLPADLTRVKLTREHDRQTVVGHLVEVFDTPAGLEGLFTVARTPQGDLALLEATERVRDGVSVDLDDVELDGDVITAAALTAVGLVTFPAYDDGRVLSVAASRHHPTEGPTTMTRTQLARLRALSAQTDRTEAETAELSALTSLAEALGIDPTAEPEPETEPETEPGRRRRDDDPAEDDGDDDDAEPQPGIEVRPVAVASRRAQRPSLSAGRTPGRGVSLTAAMDRMERAAVERGAPGVVAALADILPAMDTGGGAFRPQWLGELWTPVAASRDFIESVTHARLSSGLKVHGWKWDTYPEVGPYAGNKTEIPTNTATLVPAEAPVKRFAGGWDLDRIFADLGDPGFISAFFAAAVRDLAAKQEAGMAADLLAAAGTPADPAPADLWGAVDIASRTLQLNGASMTFVGISSDLWSQYVSTARAEVPWWVPNGSAPNLRDATGTAADIRFFANHTLPAGTVLAGDRRAVTFYESDTIRVQAINLPQGGIDLGVFSYQSTLVNDDRGLVEVKTTAAAPEAARTSSKGSK